MIQVTTSHYQTVPELLLNDAVTIISMNDVLNVINYGLGAWDAKESRGFEHRYMALWHFLNEACTHFIIDADAPWRTRGDLFADNETIGKPAMYGRRDHTEDFRSPLDCHQLAFGGNLARVESRDLPIEATIVKR